VEALHFESNFHLTQAFPRGVCSLPVSLLLFCSCSVDSQQASIHLWLKKHTAGVIQDENNQHLLKCPDIYHLEGYIKQKPRNG